MLRICLIHSVLYYCYFHCLNSKLSGAFYAFKCCPIVFIIKQHALPYRYGKHTRNWISNMTFTNILFGFIFRHYVMCSRIVKPALCTHGSGKLGIKLACTTAAENWRLHCVYFTNLLVFSYVEHCINLRAWKVQPWNNLVFSVCNIFQGFVREFIFIAQVS